MAVVLNTATLMDPVQRVKQNFEASIQIKLAAVDSLAPPIAGAAGAIAQALLNGNKIMACGNGGSAADAQHFSAEMLNRFEKGAPGPARHCPDHGLIDPDGHCQ